MQIRLPLGFLNRRYWRQKTGTERSRHKGGRGLSPDRRGEALRASSRNGTNDEMMSRYLLLRVVGVPQERRKRQGGRTECVVFIYSLAEVRRDLRPF